MKETNKNKLHCDINKELYGLQAMLKGLDAMAAQNQLDEFEKQTGVAAMVVFDFLSDRVDAVIDKVEALAALAPEPVDDEN